MVAVMRQRSWSGLAPDLLLVNGDTALRLRQAGLVDPFPIRKDQMPIFNEEELGRLRSPDGRLEGLPVLVHTQLGCFNRQRQRSPHGPVARPLLAVVDRGQHGRPASHRQSRAGTTAPPDRTPGPDGLAGLDAERQQPAAGYLLPRPAHRRSRIQGRPARLDPLSQHRAAPTAQGDGHRASPINRLTQLTLTLGSQTVLPANRFVTVPVQSSKGMAAMVAAANQGLQANSLVNLVHINDPRIPRLQTLLTQLVFGEASP